MHPQFSHSISLNLQSKEQKKSAEGEEITEKKKSIENILILICYSIGQL